MIFLRFPDEKTYIDATAHYLDDEGSITLPNIDVVGIIYEGGTYDTEGNELTPSTPVDGYHVNAIEIPDDWQQYVIDRPNNPYRIFAGY